jgi:mono/diheme cytochrome c family protein
MFRLFAGVIGPAGLLVAAVSIAQTPGAADKAAAAAWGTPAMAPRRGGNSNAAKVANPVAATPESVASGRRTYRRMCALCHGAEGKGDGGGAGAGGVPADLTAGRWRYGGSDGELFSVIHDGTSADMQGYGEQLSETDIWNLVNYIRTLGPARAP